MWEGESRWTEYETETPAGSKGIFFFFFFFFFFFVVRGLCGIDAASTRFQPRTPGYSPRGPGDRAYGCLLAAWHCLTSDVRFNGALPVQSIAVLVLCVLSGGPAAQTLFCIHVPGDIL